MCENGAQNATNMKMKALPTLINVKKDEGSRWPQLLTASAATLVVFTTGFHTGWPAPSVPKLLSTEYPFEVSNEGASYITIIAYLGNIIGGFFGTIVMDHIGRKRTIMSIAIPQMVSFSLIATSYHLMVLLYVARFVGGFAEGMTFSIVPLYIAEIAEPRVRGTLGTMMSITCIGGMLFVNIVGSFLTIKLSALIFLVFPFVFLLLFWKMPESPYYLLMKNQEKEAEAVLKFLRRRENVGQELSVLIKDVNRQMSESGTYRDILAIDSNRKAFLLIIGARVSQQLTGATPFALYAQMLFKSATQSLPPYIGASILLLVQLGMVFVSVVFVDRFGRKPLLIASAGGCFLDLLVQAIYFTLKEYTAVDVTVIDWFPLVMMSLFIIFFTMGLGVVVNIMCSEMFSASIKSKTVCLVNVVFAVGMMATTKFYQATADEFGLTVPYWSFAICTLGGTLFFYFFLPETKGKSLEEIQQELKGNKKLTSL